MTVGNARRLRAVFFAVLAAGGLAMAGCSQPLPQNTLHPDGPVAQTQYDLFKLVFWIAAVIFVIVQGGLLFAVLKYRRRSDAERPVQVHGNTRLEVIWTLIPALLLAGVGVPTIRTVFALSEKPENALNVKVIGKQWWWEYEYPDHKIVTANELHIPVGRDIALRMESADVIHAFWPARLAGKQDVVPGQVNPLTFSADRPGTYYGQCAEYCGDSHANMRLRVIAMEPDDFDRWVAEQRRPAAQPVSGYAAEGYRLFMEGQCVGCHAISGSPAQSRVGPDLTHFASRKTFAGSMFENSPENLYAWLENPPKVKPGSKMPDYNLTDDQIRKLIAYLETLR